MANKPSTRKKPAAAATVTPTTPAAPAKPLAPIDLGTADAAAIAEQAKRIGVAQDTLNEAIAVAAAAQLVVNQAAESEVEPARQAFDDACDAVLAAREAFDQLIGRDLAAELPTPPDVAATPAGADAAQIALQQGSGIASNTPPPIETPASASAADTTGSSKDEDEEPNGPLTSITGAFPSGADMDAMADEQIDAVIFAVRAAAADGRLDEALSHLEEERAGARAMSLLGLRIDQALAVEEVSLRRSKACWPVEAILYRGSIPPIGEELMVEPGEFSTMFDAGLVSDQPPEITAIEEV